MVAIALASLAYGQDERASLQPFSNSRELLESLGVEESHFRLLVDGQPLDASEQEPLLRVLYAIRKCPLVEIERFARTNFRPSDIREAGHELRGEIFRLRGEVKRVTIEKPLAEAVDRYELKQFYRCQVLLREHATPATIVALAVPKAWPLDQDISERISCLGFYLKLAPGEADAPQPVFATQRLAWHPDGMLGDLEMDFGLFEHVQNKTAMGGQERECFYQLLAAVGRAKPQELFELTQRPPDEDYSVVPLFNEPDQQHGKLVAVTGTARRAILVKLDAERDADIISRLGLDHYYQVEIFTNDSQGNPLVFCVRELPAGMPQGPSIYETVRIPGYFFKSWAYPIPSLDNKPAPGHQLAPLLVGNQMHWLRSEWSRNSLAGAIGGGLFAAVLLGAIALVWFYHRSDRRSRQRPVNDSPDFSHLR
jgi:hypothetical protein